MHLNRKGYMLVEIVVASVLAMSIAYYLLNLTYKFKNTNEDLYQSYNYMSDKILITKNIMNDLEGGTISDIDKIGESLFFKLNDDSRGLLISNNGNKTKLQYGKYDSASGLFDKSDKSYYEKEFNSSLIVGGLDVVEDRDSVTIKIPIKSIYSDEVYTIKLFANKQ